MLLKKSVLIQKGQREICAQKSVEIASLVKKSLNSKRSLMHYEGRPNNYLFQLFLKLYGRPEENSSYFSNVQPCIITCILEVLKIGYADIPIYHL